MKKILTALTTVAIILGISGCGKAQDKTPVYKFTSKVDGKSWSTDMVVPNTTPTEAAYVSYLYYSPSSKYIAIDIKDPKTNHWMELYIYIPGLSSAVGTYTYEGEKFFPEYHIAKYDDPTINSIVGQFEITKFGYDLNTGKITSFSGKFSFTQTAKHSNDATKTTVVTEGEVNNLVNP